MAHSPVMRNQAFNRTPVPRRRVTPLAAAGSLLSPSSDAAVVGGNVLTSQRVTDVVLKAFNACAASQGGCYSWAG